ncbi:MAG TPA: ABC transporter permease [Bryobacteraceae bacterium]|nr:ABC transporter permease [Bryobacteraceae bacterium]
MNAAGYRNLRVEARGHAIAIHLDVENSAQAECIGWQLFDPDTNVFIQEGEWLKLAPGDSVPVDLEISLPPEPASYRVYVSPIDPAQGWAYAQGKQFLVIDAEVAAEHARVLNTKLTTRGAMLRRGFFRALPSVFTYPIRTVTRNRALIRSMVRRDILARYRGSFGDVFWTILNPLLLMLTYYFVFGVVLRTRFGADRSSAGFVLYFLAGMLPWLAFSEPVGRSPGVILEHRNFVKKLVFPLETLPVNQAVAGLVTEVFALAVFLCLLLGLRHHIPLTAAWLPVLLVPQLLFTLGVCWFLAALGVFMRDLAQIMGFVLTLWFFITPICYPESSLSPAATQILSLNPLFMLVRGYRAIFLENSAPALTPLLAVWIISFVTFLLGHLWFHKLRRTFADVI